MGSNDLLERVCHSSTGSAVACVVISFMCDHHLSYFVWTTPSVKDAQSMTSSLWSRYMSLCVVWCTMHICMSMHMLVHSHVIQHLH